MMDLPPTDQPPTQAMIETINENDALIHNIKYVCERSVKAGLKDKYCNPLPRALFVDICNARNHLDFFQYKIMYNLLYECDDCCGPRGQDQYLEYHVDGNEIHNLGKIIRNGSDCKGVPIPIELQSYPHYMQSIYVLLSNHPELTQSFTEFMCGKNLDKTQSLDKFLKSWYENTKAFIDSIPALP